MTLVKEVAVRNTVKNRRGAADPIESLRLLQYACEAGYDELFRLLIDSGALTGSQRELHDALNRYDLQRVHALISCGVPPDVPDLLGNTALHYASSEKDSRVVQQLLAHRASPNAKNLDGRTPLHFAADQGSNEVLATLLQSPHIDVNIREKRSGRTALFVAAVAKRAGAISQLLEAGADANIPDHDRVAPLHKAAKANDRPFIKRLLERGANPNAMDSKNRTPLHYAVRNNALVAVDMLLNKNADPNIRDHVRRTPLSYVRDVGGESLIDSLRNAGAELTGTGRHGDTAPPMAKRECEVSVVRQPLAVKANLNELDHERDAPLHISAGHGHAGGLRLPADARTAVSLAIGKQAPKEATLSPGDVTAEGHSKRYERTCRVPVATPSDVLARRP